MKQARFSAIKVRILLVTLVPAFLLIIGISTYLISSKTDDLEHAYLQRGQAIVEQLATAGIYGLFTGNEKSLELLVDEALSQHKDIYQILIKNKQDMPVLLRTANLKDKLPGNTFKADIRSSGIPLDLEDFPDTIQPLTDNSMASVLGSVEIWLDNQYTVAAKQSIVLNVVIFMLIGFFVTGALASVLSGRIARPIEKLTESMKQLREGDLDIRTEVSAGGELAELQQGFNTMAEELSSVNERMLTEIEQATSDLQQTMDALEIRNIELDLARKRALEAASVKSDFLASMSHEIRTPMNGILGFANMLNKTNLDITQREYVSTINDSVSNLLKIINDILDFSKLESGMGLIKAEHFNLRGCINGVLGLLAPGAYRKQLELISLIYNDVPEKVIGDQTRVAQILTNLIGNAIKFTETGEISVRVMLEEEQETDLRIAISVTDTGMGIPAEEQSNLFTAFTQGSLTKKSHGSGTGLGLSICRKLVESMNGKIRLSSKPGEGSCFQVVFDLERDNANTPMPPRPLQGLMAVLVEPNELSRFALKNELSALGVMIEDRSIQSLEDVASLKGKELLVLGIGASTNALSEARTLIPRLKKMINIPILALISSVDEKEQSLLMTIGADQCRTKLLKRFALQNVVLKCVRGRDESLSDVPAEEDAVSQTHNGGRWLDGKTILVVDDNRINLNLMKSLLLYFGADVIPAMDGESALAVALEQPVDLIFMDIHMPRMNGVVSMQRIREKLDHHVPIVALTADALSKARKLAEEAGFDAYLTKPLDEGRLIHTLSSMFNIEAPQYEESLIAEGEKASYRSDQAILPTRDIKQAIRIAGGSEKIATTLYSDFLEELPHSISTIQAAFHSHDWEVLWQLVHRLIGSAAVCGVPELHQRLAWLQTAVSQQNPDSTGELLLAVQQEVEALKNMS